jgi:hypothetical protein
MAHAKKWFSVGEPPGLFSQSIGWMMDPRQMANILIARRPRYGYKIRKYALCQKPK